MTDNEKEEFFQGAMWVLQNQYGGLWDQFNRGTKEFIHQRMQLATTKHLDDNRDKRPEETTP